MNRIDRILNDAARRAVTYLEGLDRRAGCPVAREPFKRLRALEEPLPAEPTDPREVIRILDEACSGATMAMAGPRFFGFVIGGSLPAALGANWLAGAWDQNSAFASVTPSTAFLEDVALRWLVDLFGFPRGTAGSFVTGATMANFTALAAARHAVLARAGWNVEADGLIGAPPLTVIVGEEAHSTLFKSLGPARPGAQARCPRARGLRRAACERRALPRVTGPTIVCTQAGNVNTGAFDPIGEICDRLAGTGAWVHVDGAFGLWAAASPELRHLAPGPGESRLLGNRRAQVAERALRQRSCLREGRGDAARLHGGHRGVPSARRPAAQSFGFHTRALAPVPRRRGVGGAEITRAQRHR